MYYREELFGYTIEKLIEKRLQLTEVEEAAQARAQKYNARKPLSLQYFDLKRCSNHVVVHHNSIRHYLYGYSVNDRSVCDRVFTATETVPHR